MSSEEGKFREEHGVCIISRIEVVEREKPPNEIKALPDTRDDMEDMTDEEKRQSEAHKLALMCYSEKLANKEEDDVDEEKLEGVHDDTKERVKFAETVVVCPTYSSQEYDREPDNDWREKERAVEEMVEKLDIVIIETDPVALKEVHFVDFYKMMENSDDEEAPICDFGVYISQVETGSKALNLNIKSGDLVLCMDEEDFLSSTAAIFKTHLTRIGKTRVTLTLGRRNSEAE